MVGVTVSSCLVLMVSQNTRNSYLAKISLSSRQKALAEELGRKMYDIERKASQGQDIRNEQDDFKVTLTRWESAQKALITGSEHYGTSGSNSNASQEMLQMSSGQFVHGREFLTRHLYWKY